MSTMGHIAASPRESTAQPGRTGESLLDRIGNTPLLRLERVGQQFPNVAFCAKAEWFNPGGSVKDRPPQGMLQAGLASGALCSDKTIIDATSGNTGIAYAMIGAALGFPVRLCLPDSASHERKRILGAFAAELVITPGDEGTDGAIGKVREIVAGNPDKYFYPDQYSNPANGLAREEGLLVRPSAAASLLGCFRVAAGIPQDAKAVVVTVFADSALKYLNERFWDEE